MKATNQLWICSEVLRSVVTCYRWVCKLFWTKIFPRFSEHRSSFLEVFRRSSCSAMINVAIKYNFSAAVVQSWRALYTRLRKTALHHTGRGEGGRSQSLNEVPQNFTEVYNVDDVSRRNQHRKEKKNLSSIVITGVKLASYWRKTWNFVFHFYGKTLSQQDLGCMVMPVC